MGITEPLGTELRARKVARHAEARRATAVAISAEAHGAVPLGEQFPPGCVKIAPEQLPEDHQSTLETSLRETSGTLISLNMSVAKRVQNPEFIAAVGCAIFRTAWDPRDSDSHMVDRTL